MDLSLDNLREFVFDYNSDFFLDMYEQVREECEEKDLLLKRQKDSTWFVQIILDNMHFFDINDDDDDLISD
jgi:hypothetical protein